MGKEQMPDDYRTNRLPDLDEEPDEWKYHKIEKYRQREREGKIPDKLPPKGGGPKQLDNPTKDQSPEWDDLSDEQKAAFKTPMKYANWLMNQKIDEANKSDESY